MVIVCSMLCYGSSALTLGDGHRAAIADSGSTNPQVVCHCYTSHQRKSTSDITIMRTIAKHCLATLFLTHANIGGAPTSRTSVLSRVVHRHFCCIYCNNFLFVFGSGLYATSVVFHCSCCIYNTDFGRCVVGLGMCSMWYFLRKNIAKNR